MFYCKTSSYKKTRFLEKIGKKPFVGGHDCFEGRGTSCDKNQYNLFCRHLRSEYFSFKNFFERNNLFQNNIKKLFLGVHNHFWGNGASDNKNKYNPFWGQWGTKYSFKVFFSKNFIPSDLNPKNWFCMHIFPHIWGSVQPMFPKTMGFIHEWISEGIFLGPIECNELNTLKPLLNGHY